MLGHGGSSCGSNKKVKTSYGKSERYSCICQSFREYTTSFKIKPTTLEVYLQHYATHMKYISSSNEYIYKELKLFSIDIILEVSIITIAIEGKA